MVPNIPVDDTEKSDDEVVPPDGMEESSQDQSKEVNSLHTQVDTISSVPCLEVPKGKKRKRRGSERDSDCMVGKERVSRVGRLSKVPQIVATKSSGISISRVADDILPLTDKELELVRRLT